MGDGYTVQVWNVKTSWQEVAWARAEHIAVTMALNTQGARVRVVDEDGDLVMRRGEDPDP